ncbi:MAG: DegT/DnrJ/EryC1/StrS family aminotransferase [Phycisphaeraceae bacterium]|nr:DegT/DnrJ/EryC1/StrS family aminotransferase [Phycisphaeraceae bacterium]MCW5753493.1 DegT/DnrJ/EryC1/StrS family aminotransferase [Phycisphaeraceae bacterium]
MAHSTVAAAGLALHGGTPVSSAPVPFMSLALTEADIQAANAVLRSGILRQGARCAELERRWSELTNARHTLTCANGTCALQLAYEPLFAPGDEVLVPAWSYIATVSMVVARGGQPVFCDALPDTFQFDVADAERRITPRTRAIACTHLYGMPVDIDAVDKLARKHNLKVIYDAAQAHLATYKGKGLGAYGDAVTYSLYATKNLATGEGGLISTNDDALARQLALLRSHGETDKYLHAQVGYNYRLNDIAAAIGCSRLDRLPAQTAQRQQNADRYDAIVTAIDGITPPARTPGAQGVWHLYTVQIDPAAFTCTRDEFCKALMAEGVPTATHYPRSLTRQPAFAQFVSAAAKAHGEAYAHPPVAEALASRVFCLPMHHDLTDEHFRIVAEALHKVAEAYRA